MKRTSICLLMVLMLPLFALADERVVSKAHGIPTYLSGDLGFVDAMPTKSSAHDEDLFRLSAKIFLQDLLRESFGASGSEEMEISRVRADELGTVHVRFNQTLHGLPVVGAQMMVHSEAASGRVYAVNGNFAPDFGLPVPTKATAQSSTELTATLANYGFHGKVVNKPALLYFHDAESGNTHLAWKVQAQGLEKGDFFDSDFYLDAFSNEIVAIDARIHTAKVRRTYDATGSVVTNTSITGVPGTLVCSDGQTCPDASSQRAHTGAGDVYDYYSARFGRDSLNDNGMTLTSSVHVGSNWPNAAWYNNQMIYGDGDGSTLDDLTKSFDVIAHELTHGVTDFESDLIYQKESGALNEALSDIFGVAADSYSRGDTVDAATWKLGEEVYTPSTAGDALRYMDDPDLDGYSKGYYPERLYSGSCTPSNSNDQCGVHGNSGIANLAFYLMVQGGTHPRGKTSVNVPAIGMLKAEQIFYRAQTSCLTASSNFQAARDCTAQAATDIYGATENAAVHAAWDAVGVPGGPPAAAIVLQNGVAVTGQAASTGTETFYTLAVPSGATNLTFTMSGGSGDADLYVRFGSQPTTSTYDCRPYASGNNESCPFATPSTGTYHVMIRAYSTYSGVSLVANYTTTIPNNAPNASFTSSTNNLTASFTDTSTDSDGTIASRSWTFGDGGTASSTNPSHTYSAAGTYTVTLTVTDDDGATVSASASVTVTAPSGGNALQNGVALTGLSGSTGAENFYTIAIPAGATNLSVAMSGGSGDADLYLRFGSQPTTSTYDCRPYQGGNNETCTVASPSTGTYHVMVRAYSTYSGVSLVATWDEPSGNCGGSGSVNNISGAANSEARYTFDVDGCASTVTIAISGGTGDSDLYVRFGSQPTTGTYDCRPYLNGNNETCTFNTPSAGTYHILVRGYTTFSGVTLDASYE